MKKALVIGLGLSGKAAADFLLKNGAQVIGVDRNHDIVNGVNHFEARHESEPIAWENIDLVVVSPGVSPIHPLYLEANKRGIEILGEMELACRKLNQPFLGITGTNGKTTVTLLTAHVLNDCGKAAVALGNVGVPITAEIGPNIQGKIIVAELSSYQLDTLHSKVIDAGVLLNVTPDHLDRYSTMERYAEAKCHMKDCIKQGGDFYVEEKTLQEYRHFLANFPVKTYGYSPSSAIYTDKKSVFFQQKIEYILPVGYRGRASHDVENILAAYALCKRMGVSATQFIKALETFKKPPHRIEYVEKIQGVTFYDDSKGTNIDAVIRAVESLPGRIVLIAGGVDKGASYEPWIAAFQGKVSAICAIGQAAEKMKRELSSKIKVDLFSTLEQAVHAASQTAQNGDTVLLSPGCSSFDMFRDYAHRGEEFKRIVHELKGRRT